MTEPVAEEIHLETVETEEIQEEEPKAAFEIKDLDDLKRLLMIAQGDDPDAQQAIAQFMDLQSKVERSYFPDKITTICIGQLKGFGSALYEGEENNPFDLVADILSVGFMGFKGFKSNQFVDMTRQTPNLDALKTASEDVKQSVAARIFGRGKSE